MSEPLSLFFTWFLPPIVGAVIGWVTNDIAIRMLFRPLKAIRIFGLRLPFTPGVIPRQRAQLAESIGHMVSTELITAQTLRVRLESPGFRLSLEENIRSLIHGLLNRPLGELAGGGRETLAASLRKFLAETLFRFFSSRSFILAVRQAAGSAVRSLGEKQLEDLARSLDIRSLVADRLLPLLERPETRKKILAGMQSWLQEQSERKATIGDFLPEEALLAVSQLASAGLPELLGRVFERLREQDLHLELERRGKFLLSDILDKLNLFQRFILTAGQFDRTLEQKMPEIVDETLEVFQAAAEDEDNQGKILETIQKALLAWRKTSVAQACASLSARTPLPELLEKGLKLLTDGGARRKLVSALERLLARQGKRKLSEFLASSLGLQEQEIVDFASFHLLDYLSKRQTAQALAAEVASFSLGFLEEHRETNLAQFFHLDESQELRAARFITPRLLGILDQRLPSLIQSLDVRELVVKKIDGLDVAEVERLLLMVIAKHLKWIDFFGALLGALIGLSQSLLRLAG